MGISERQEEILRIIEAHVYISVDELAQLVFTSPSSIRRDLTALQNLGLVRRTHGGVSLPEAFGRVASFTGRLTKNVREKRLIAEKASVLLKDGQSILLDSSTTSGFLVPYIARLDSVTLFTNNLETAMSAIKEGISTYCIGGKSINGSSSLGGSMTYKALLDIRADIMFFSSQSISLDGIISDSTEDENFVRSVMLKQAKQTVFLCDNEKFGTTSLYRLAELDSIDYAVFDKPYPDLKTKAKIL